jgi:enoyl-CoA hydratase
MELINMVYDNISMDITQDCIGRITLNRPEQMNPLDWHTVKELKSCIAQLEQVTQIRVVIITGKGRAFSAGGDMKEYLDLYRKPKRYRKFLKDFSELFDMIEESSKIYIAAVNGYCLAGGIGFLLACDFVVASEEAKIGDAHLNFAQPPAAGISQRLPRLIGILRARYLFYSGDSIDAHEAKEMGLVNQVVPSSALLKAAEEFAKKTLKKSFMSLKVVKQLVNKGQLLNLHESLEMELNRVHEYATSCEDATEGLLAFIEKRKPKFGSS